MALPYYDEYLNTLSGYDKLMAERVQIPTRDYLAFYNSAREAEKTAAAENAAAVEAQRVEDEYNSAMRAAREEMQFNANQATLQFERNQAAAREERAWSEYMRDTQLTSAFRQARENGVNPYIMFNGGSVSAPSGASASGSAASYSSGYTSSNRTAITSEKNANKLLLSSLALTAVNLLKLLA